MPEPAHLDWTAASEPITFESAECPNGSFPAVQPISNDTLSLWPVLEYEGPESATPRVYLSSLRRVRVISSAHTLQHAGYLTSIKATPRKGIRIKLMNENPT